VQETQLRYLQEQEKYHGPAGTEKILSLGQENDASPRDALTKTRNTRAKKQAAPDRKSGKTGAIIFAGRCQALKNRGQTRRTGQ
jgi:hypothetical protein